MNSTNSINSINPINSVYLSIVVPLYNEEGNVAKLYHEIRSTVDLLKMPYEIIFIDDRSTDTTYERLLEIKRREEEEGESCSKTKLIRFARNYGQTSAMQAGFDFASGDVIVSMDGDLQNDPADIPRLLGKLNEGFDVVCGWRKDRKDKKLTRIIPSKVANWIIGKVTGVPIHDNGCSLKAYKSNVIRSVRLYSDMHRFIPAITTLVGARIAEIIVNHRPRKFGKTKYGLSRVWKVMFDIITVKMVIHFHEKPILWFGMLGFIFGLLGIGMGIASLFLFFRGVQSIVFPAASFLLLSLFGSLISWGLLAEYFVRIKKSPPQP